MKVSDSDIASYARGAGLTGNNVAIAVAVALAESGGESTSHNPLPPDDSYGLWQINMLGSMGPSRRRQFGITQNTDLYDPAVNARAMSIISGQGTNWSPWSTYTSGKYRIFLPRGQAVANSGNATASPQVTTASLTIPDLSGISNFVAFFTNPGTWKRAAIGLLGFALIMIALWQFSGIQKHIAPVVKGVAKKGAEVAATAAIA